MKKKERKEDKFQLWFMVVRIVLEMARVWSTKWLVGQMNGRPAEGECNC